MVGTMGPMSGHGALSGPPFVEESPEVFLFDTPLSAEFERWHIAGFDPAADRLFVYLAVAGNLPDRQEGGRRCDRLIVHRRPLVLGQGSGHQPATLEPLDGHRGGRAQREERFYPALLRN